MACAGLLAAGVSLAQPPGVDESLPGRSPLAGNSALDFGLYGGGTGAGARIGASAPLGSPKVKGRRTKYTVGTLHLTNYSTYARNELSLRGGFGIRRVGVRANGFYLGYGGELEYLLTTSEGLEGNVTLRDMLTTSTYVSGFGVAALGSIGYDWGVRDPAGFRLELLYHVSLLDVYPGHGGYALVPGGTLSASIAL